MSKIDELIQEYCPNGVEFKLLGDLEDSGVIKLGRGNVISKKDIANEPGNYPIYSSSASGVGEFGRYNQYMFDDERLSWSVDGGGRFFYRPAHKYSVTNVSGWMKVLRGDILDTRYLFHILDSAWLTKKFDYIKKAHPSVIRNEYTIPVPPLEVQKEIVKILDTFTELEAELAAELAAELEARRTQYEHYRNQLLTFDDVGGVRWKTLGEVAMYSKSRIAAADMTSDSYVGVDNLLQNTRGKTASTYVPTEGNLARYDAGDILIGNIRPYLKKIWCADRTGGSNGDVLILQLRNQDTVTSSYLYQILASDKFFSYNMKFSKGAKMPRGDKASILKYPVAIPPIADQNRIVSILDKFERLVNDISTGLPAEIAARRQQYEYYRNKLLTFKELSV